MADSETPAKAPGIPVEGAKESDPTIPEATPQAPVQAIAPDPSTALEPDDADLGGGGGADADSAYSEFGPGSDTTTVTTSIRNYRYENGRRYHAYRDGEYFLPNDESEQDRLDLLHHIFRLILDGALFRAPLHNPQRVLDFGTGTGIWAIDFADERPGAEVLGTDLSPIQPQWVPPNLTFVVDDAESDWTFTSGEAFDFIHGRAMSGSIKDWSRLYDQIYKHLKPGGWVEMQEYETWAISDDGTSDNAHAMNEWQARLDEATEIFGKKMNVATTHKQRLIDAGFVDVSDDIYKVPIGPWPKDPKLKEIGRYELVHMLDAVEPYTLALFTRVLKWDTERAQALMAGVRADFKNPQFHIYSNFHFVYGRKPETT